MASPSHGALGPVQRTLPWRGGSSGAPSARGAPTTRGARPRQAPRRLARLRSPRRGLRAWRAYSARGPASAAGAAARPPRQQAARLLARRPAARSPASAGPAAARPPPSPAAAWIPCARRGRRGPCPCPWRLALAATADGAVRVLKTLTALSSSLQPPPSHLLRPSPGDHNRRRGGPAAGQHEGLASAVRSGGGPAPVRWPPSPTARGCPASGRALSGGHGSARARLPRPRRHGAPGVGARAYCSGSAAPGGTVSAPSLTGSTGTIPRQRIHLRWELRCWAGDGRSPM